MPDRKERRRQCRDGGEKFERQCRGQSRILQANLDGNRLTGHIVKLERSANPVTQNKPHGIVQDDRQRDPQSDDGNLIMVKGHDNGDGHDNREH